jgi:hypothetical protein
MPQITDADRQAAQALRVLLADLSGFWFKADDESPLCAALARHRIDAERKVGRKWKAVEERIYGPNIRLVRKAPAANAGETPAAA